MYKVLALIAFISFVTSNCNHTSNSNSKSSELVTDSGKKKEDTSELSESGTSASVNRSKSMNNYFPFELNDINGEYHIVAQIEGKDLYPKYYDLFKKYNYEGNGYCWEGHIIQILEKLDKELLNHIEFDPEAGAFFAIVNTKENQLRFVEVLSPIFSDMEKIEDWIAKADRGRIDD